LLPERSVEAVLNALRDAPLEHRGARDILRASGLPLLAADHSDVAHDLDMVRHGKKLSPVLLVPGDAARGAPLQVADGYHRLCAINHLDDEADIPSRLVGLPDFD